MRKYSLSCVNIIILDYRLCKKYCKATDKFVTCNDCEKRFHATCANPSEKELSSLENENEPWYCSDCKADCGLCSGAVLNSHKAVQCDKLFISLLSNILKAQITFNLLPSKTSTITPEHNKPKTQPRVYNSSELEPCKLRCIVRYPKFVKFN